MNARLLRLPLLLAVFLAAIHAPAQPVADPLSEQQRGQADVRSRTRHAAALFEGLIAEFERNALPAEDTRLLRAIHAILHQLSDDEMQQVLAWLQTARTETAPPGQSALQRAFTGQQAILEKLRHLVAEQLQRGEIFQLAARTAALERTAEQHRKATTALTPPSGTEALRQRLSDNRALHDHTREFLDELARHATGPAPALARAARRALQHVADARLPWLVEHTAHALNEGRLDTAAAAQTRARDEFHAITRQIRAAADPAAALSELRSDLARLAAQQADLAARAHSPTNPAALAREQSELAHRATRLRQELRAPAPGVDGLLWTARERMTQSTTALLSSNSKLQTPNSEPPATNSPAHRALAPLAEALRTLDDQITRDTAHHAAHGDAALPRLRAARDELATLEHQQNRRALVPDDEAQSRLREQTRSLQSRLAATAPLAAQTIAQAARQMQQPACAAEARDTLAEAREALSRDIQRHEETAADTARLAAAARAATTLAQALPENPPASPASFRDLAARADAFRRALPRQTPAAAEAAGEAAERLENAATAIEEGQPTSARRATAAARAALQAAASQLQKQAGGEPLPPTDSPTPPPSSINPSPPHVAGQPGSPAESQNSKLKTQNSEPPFSVPTNVVVGSSEFLALPARDRAALLQALREKHPVEFAPQIEQFLRNLADTPPLQKGP